MKYSKKMALFIADNYPGMNSGAFVEMFNNEFGTKYSLRSLTCKANSLGIYKKDEYRWGRYTNDMITFLKERFSKYTTKKLTSEFNKHFGTQKTTNQIIIACNNHGILRREIKYTSEMIDFLQRYAPEFPRSKLTEMFNKKFETNIRMKKIQDLCTRYTIPREVFKNEYTDINTLRVYIRYEKGKWKPKKDYIYEKYFGKIEEDESVIFIDGNYKNFDPENLLKLSSKEVHTMITYGFMNKNAQTTLVGLSLVRLKIKADELEAKIKPKKQEDQ